MASAASSAEGAAIRLSTSIEIHLRMRTVHPDLLSANPSLSTIRCGRIDGCGKERNRRIGHFRGFGLRVSEALPRRSTDKLNGGLPHVRGVLQPLFVVAR